MRAIEIGLSSAFEVSSRVSLELRESGGNLGEVTKQ